MSGNGKGPAIARPQGLVYSSGMLIDHDKNEPPIDRTSGPWKLVAAIIALLWAWYFYFQPFDWTSIALGLGTGVVLTAWAIEVTGNKIPPSWRGNPPSSDRTRTD